MSPPEGNAAPIIIDPSLSDEELAKVAKRLVDIMVPMMEQRMEARLMEKIGRTLVGKFSIGLAIIGTAVLAYAEGRGWVNISFGTPK